MKQDAASSELKPGYYWLSYAWDNLFLACTLCNSVNKGTQFPLRNAADRARSHLDSTDAEQPLLLRPDNDNPDDHIAWREDQPRGLTDEGWATIEVAGLIRDDDPRRTKAFNKLRLAHHRIWKLHTNPDFHDMAHDYCEELRRAKRAESQFSAMSRAYLATLNFPDGFQP